MTRLSPWRLSAAVLLVAVPGPDLPDGRTLRAAPTRSDRFVPVATRGARERPEPRVAHSATYHPALGMVLVFRGRDADGVETNDLWRWDGVRWHLLVDGAGGPTPRAHHVMAYDPPRRRVVVQGGGTVARNAGDAWAWSPIGWTRVAGEGPGPRSHHQMAYDPGAEAVLLYGGGRDEDGFTGDLWTLERGGWTSLDQRLEPGRVLARMVTTEEGILLFGGLIRGRPRSRELWEWKAGGWTLLAEHGPPGLTYPGLAWNRARGRLLLSLTYDAGREVVVLFGGRTSAGPADDVWEWDGEEWKRVW